MKKSEFEENHTITIPYNNIDYVEMVEEQQVEINTDNNKKAYE